MIREKQQQQKIYQLPFFSFFLLSAFDCLLFLNLNLNSIRCQVCNKAFSQAANLTAHNRIHTKEKPFPCPICQRKFSQSSSVTTHLRTHTKERPYNCHYCSKSFSDSSTLTKHMRIHSGEKPYRFVHY